MFTSYVLLMDLSLKAGGKQYVRIVTYFCMLSASLLSCHVDNCGPSSCCLYCSILLSVAENYSCNAVLNKCKIAQDCFPPV